MLTFELGLVDLGERGGGDRLGGQLGENVLEEGGREGGREVCVKGRGGMWLSLLAVLKKEGDGGRDGGRDGGWTYLPGAPQLLLQYLEGHVVGEGRYGVLQLLELVCGGGTDYIGANGEGLA